MTKTAEIQEDERAIDQARAQLSSIEDMMDRLKHAQECTEDDCKRTDAYGGDSEEYHDEDSARQAIEESPLSVQVRADWHDSTAQNQKPDEYLILLCTGGPAIRITGGLSEHGEPESSIIQYQDWFTPWETYSVTLKEEETLLKYAQCFYFGE